MGQSPRGVSILVVVSQAFDAIILRYFDLCEALQRVNSVGKLPRYIQLLYVYIIQVLSISLYICYYLINLFKVCLGSCAHACFYPRSTRFLNSLHILLFACQNNPSWGRSARRLLLPFGSFQDCHVWPLPNSFYNVYLNTLDTFLRWLLSRDQYLGSL